VLRQDDGRRARRVAGDGHVLDGHFVFFFFLFFSRLLFFFAVREFLPFRSSL
jgi:hypothetical protein